MARIAAVNALKFENPPFFFKTISLALANFSKPVVFLFTVGRAVVVVFLGGICIYTENILFYSPSFLVEMLTELRPVVITLCVGYWDFLRLSLPHTLKFASTVYIATTFDEVIPWDLPSSVKIHRTDAFFQDGAAFNKAAVTREVQNHVHTTHPDDWVLLLDADVLVPSDSCFGVSDKECMYGITRLDYPTPDDVLHHRAIPYFYPGAGYFQLYFDKTKEYPGSSHDCSECDILFYRSFPKAELVGGAVSHVGPHTVNWKGRVSPAWPSTLSADALREIL